MKALGSYFKKKREQQNYTIRDVAEATNIAPHYIEAIEQQKFDQFPADVYAKGFIRNYALFLDLDPDPLVNEFKLNFEQDISTGSDEDPVTTQLIWYVVVVLLIIAVALVLIRFSWGQPEKQLTRKASLAPIRAPDNIKRFEDKSRRTIQLNNSPEQLIVQVGAVEKSWIVAIRDGRGRDEILLNPGETTNLKADESIRIWSSNSDGIRLTHAGNLLPMPDSVDHLDQVVTLGDDKIILRSLSSGPSS